MLRKVGVQGLRDIQIKFSTVCLCGYWNPVPVAEHGESRLTARPQKQAAYSCVPGEA